MPAVTPAEPHTRHTYGVSECHPARTPPHSTATRRPQVEQAARLAMPAVTPAEPHNPDLYGSSNAIQPARLRTPPQASAPCRGGPACPPPLFLSPCSLCPLWFAFSVSSVLLTHSFFTPRKDFCRHDSELPVRPQPPRLFGCGYAALWFASSVPSVSCPMCRRHSCRPWPPPHPLPSVPSNRSPRQARRPACHAGNSRGASRLACHAGGHAGRATQSRTPREFQRHPARTPPHSTSTRRPQVEQAARLAMPAVAPAERHNPELRGSPRAIRPARLCAPPQASAPCRGGPACPPPLFLSPCSLCPLYY